MNISNKAILLLILIVASVLRLINFGDVPFTHDEFSALFRLNFNSFSDLIEKGIKVDGHPAGIQVFLYYWTKLFGQTEWVVKLPFVLFGIGSVWLIFLIGRSWYNETVGLIASSLVASLQFAIVYSQIARPYVSGLFFSLLMVHFWTAIILNPNRRFYINCVFFIISASLCAYNHHFSLLFATIVGFSGLFFIKRELLVKYIVCGVIIFALYIPHLNIFFYQLKLGGIEGWLGKPSNDFIFRYIGYIFHYSVLSLLLVATFFLVGFYRFKKEQFFYKKLTLFIIWFFLPFIIGFLYSVFVNSVLQFSVLIFSFPFIFFILFGHIPERNPKTNLVIVLLILLINTFTLVFEREHYNYFYKSRFENILLDHKQTQDNYSNTLSIIDSSPMISQYYIEKNSIDTNFVWFSHFASLTDFKAFLEKNSELYDYLYLGIISSNHPNTIPIILDFFPTIVNQTNYFGGTTYFFSKELVSEPDYFARQDFESNQSNSWHSIDSTKTVDSVSYSGNRSYFIGNDIEWGPLFQTPLNDLMQNKNNFIDISFRVKGFESIDEVILVASLEANQKTIHWGATHAEVYVTSNSSLCGWVTVHHSVKLSDINLNYRSIDLKTYIWNKGGRNVFVDDFTIKVREGNPIIYGAERKIR